MHRDIPHAVFFTLIKLEEKELKEKIDEIFIDYTFFGGITSSADEAFLLARHIINDRNINHTVITKIIPLNTDLESAQMMATRYFNRIARDIYSIEDSDRSELL